MKLIRVEDEYGFVEHSRKEYRVSLCLIDNPKVGDWLLAHGEVAVNRVGSKEAQDILKLISQSEVGH
jgi:hydrogenase maturation factor